MIILYFQIKSTPSIYYLKNFANIKVYVIEGVPVVYKTMAVREKVHCRFNFLSTQAKITYASLNIIIGN